MREAAVKSTEQIEREIGHSLSVITEVTGGYLRGDELNVLYSSADELAPKALVEIGARTGTSSTILGAVARRHGGMLYSIEVNPAPTWSENVRRFGVSEFTRLIQARSPQVDVTRLPFANIDYLLLDGDHRIESVLADYCFWSRLVRSGGRIAFHDYLSQDGVKSAVAEILRTDGDMLKQIDFAAGSIVKDGRVLELGLIVFEKHLGGK